MVYEVTSVPTQTVFVLDKFQDRNFRLTGRGGDVGKLKGNDTARTCMLLWLLVAGCRYVGLEYLKPHVQSSSHVVTCTYEWLAFLQSCMVYHAFALARAHVCVCVCVKERETERERENDFLPSLMEHIFVEKSFLFLVFAGMGYYLLSCRQDVF